MATVNVTERQPGRALAEREIGSREPARGVPHYRPAVDILELSDELRVIANVPGAKPEQIDVRFENGVLTIHAEVAPRQEDVVYLQREYGVRDFYRVFEISQAIDARRITAAYEDGVLTLHLPKVEAAVARKIEVRSS